LGFDSRAHHALKANSTTPPIPALNIASMSELEAPIMSDVGRKVSRVVALHACLTVMEVVLSVRRH
jgi:hypothetical protein